jgi:hypothetical protein
VPAYLANAGFEIIPVPVYYPEVTQILGRSVYRRLIDIPGEIDLDGSKTLTQIDLDGKDVRFDCHFHIFHGAMVFSRS